MGEAKSPAIRHDRRKSVCLALRCTSVQHDSSNYPSTFCCPWRNGSLIMLRPSSADSHPWTGNSVVHNWTTTHTFLYTDFFYLFVQTRETRAEFVATQKVRSRSCKKWHRVEWKTKCRTCTLLHPSLDERFSKTPSTMPRNMKSWEGRETYSSTYPHKT